MSTVKSSTSGPGPQAGFSMVEFLVAAFILAFGLLGLMTLQVGAVGQAATGRSRVTAAYVAELVLQRAQMEGQHYYLAKSTSVTPTLTAVFTATPGTAITKTTFGYFNVDGVQVQDATGTALANLATAVPDANKRSPYFTASWARRGYLGTAPATTAQSQEFVVNVTWVESAQTRTLSMSRLLRY